MQSAERKAQTLVKRRSDDGQTMVILCFKSKGRWEVGGWQ